MKKCLSTGKNIFIEIVIVFLPIFFVSLCFGHRAYAVDKNVLNTVSTYKCSRFVNPNDEAKINMNNFIGGGLNIFNVGDVKVNLALETACRSRKNNEGSNYGALWISSYYPATNGSLIAAVTEMTADGNHVLPAYLNGVVVGSGASAKATNICIIPGNNKITGRIKSGNGTFESDCDSKKLDIFENDPAQGFERGGVKYTPSKKINNIIQDAVTGIDLGIDINKLANYVDSHPNIGNVKKNSNGYWSYELTVQIYRCFGDAEYGSSSCYSDSSEFRVGVDMRHTLVGNALYYKDGVAKNLSSIVDPNPNPDPVTVNYGEYAALTEKKVYNFTFCGWLREKEIHELASARGKSDQWALNAKASILHDNCFDGSDPNKRGDPGGYSSLTKWAVVYPVYRLNQTPCGGTCSSSIDIVQKKADNDSWGRNTLYLKPGDSVFVKGTFTPLYQGEKDRIVDQLSVTDESFRGIGKDMMQNGDGTFSPGWNNNPSNESIGDYAGRDFYDNKYKRPQGSKYYEYDWNNAFSILTKSNDETEWHCDNNEPFFQGVKGFNSSYSGVIEYKGTLGFRVDAKSATNTGCSKGDGVNKEYATMTPQSISFKYVREQNNKIYRIDNNGNRVYTGQNGATYYLQANINNNPKESESVAFITPYNYKLGIDFSNKDDVTAYAGESKSIKFNIDIGNKDNLLVGETYQTDVPYAKIQVQVCSGNGENDNCSKIQEEEFKQGLKADNKSRSVEIDFPDIEAGKKVKVKAMIYPCDSGKDDNWSNKEGSKTWCETVKEFTIAKRPSFQIWGGSLYSNGKISLPTVTKKIGGVDEKLTFGSWVELVLTSEGEVKGLSSGAGTAGGSNSSSFCDISTLSIPNNNCGSNYVGRTRSEDREKNRSDLVKMYDGDIVNDNIEIVDPETILGGTPIVTKTNGTVTIKGNIEYENKSYATLQEIPKRIIYAKNINIDCEVTRIDAVLIAEENINTCANGGDDNDQKRSKQLIINGSTISDKLILGRTYGAATGVNSATPAEIINYDASLYLWARKNDASRGSSKFINVSTSELPPRY